jgi:hydroxyacylglutathione hydrolase
MFLRRLYEPQLAQASYVIGCAATGEAIVIDPNRDVDQYIKVAEAEGARVSHVTETHIHADYVSGSRELVARTGATLHLSGEGAANGGYSFATADHAVLIKNGDRFNIGGVTIDAVHTPGHTPEHLTFLVTDTTAATDPVGAATGDFLFVGDVGRPDLLERAVKVAGTMEASARALYGSLQAFVGRPDWLQIWPGHGAGSACGKGISAIPQSTLGYEKRFNWAFRTGSEDAFVRDVLAGQPDPPKYFAEMKRINAEGPRVLGGFRRPALLPADALGRLIADGALVLDTRHAADFALGHVPGTINLPLNGSFTTWAGWLVPYAQDFYVVVDERVPLTPLRIDSVVRALALIGLDRVAGYVDTGAIDAWAKSGRPLATVPQIEPADLAESLRRDSVTIVDVRSAAEWGGGHIAGARHVPLGYLADRMGELPRSKPIVVHCAAGSRSAIGASVLRARGFEPVLNLVGGISAWTSQGHAIVSD